MSRDEGELIELEGDGIHWRVDAGFLRSHWTCTWGRGCQGILAVPAPELGQGCCSVGAELLDEEEGALLSALAATLEPARFEHHDAAREGGVFADERRLATRVVDGACIFLNRPGFVGGAGCALHLAALDEGESPVDWKPSVCWQLPLKVDRSPSPTDGGPTTATLRRWTRADWQAEDGDLAWCCTEAPESFDGDVPVVASLEPELRALVGDEVYVELRRRLT